MDDGRLSRGRFKRWPVATKILGGPSSSTYDCPVWPADIFILGLRQNVLLTSCVLKVGATLYFHSYHSSLSPAALWPMCIMKL